MISYKYTDRNYKWLWWVQNLFLFSLCVHVHVCVVTLGTHVEMARGCKLWVWFFCYRSLLCILVTVSLSPEARQAATKPKQSSCLSNPPPPAVALGLYTHVNTFIFLHGSWDFNLGIHACSIILCPLMYWWFVTYYLRTHIPWIGATES